jgi:hypothetical protein
MAHIDESDYIRILALNALEHNGYCAHLPSDYTPSDLSCCSNYTIDWMIGVRFLTGESRPASGSTESPVKWVPSFPGSKEEGARR